MKRMSLTALALLIGCQTQVTGSPHVDAAACLNKCTADGLSMISMVHMGDYSASCVCEVPRSAGPPNTTLTARGTGSPVAGTREQAHRPQEMQRTISPSGTQSN